MVHNLFKFLTTMSAIMENLLSMKYSKFVTVRELDYIFSLESPLIHVVKKKVPRKSVMRKNSRSSRRIVTEEEKEQKEQKEQKEPTEEKEQEQEHEHEQEKDEEETEYDLPSFMTYSPRRTRKTPKIQKDMSMEDFDEKFDEFYRMYPDAPYKLFT